MKEYLLNLIGWIYNKKKLGFTLIELNISMLIQLIVLTLVINTSILIIKSYSVLLNNTEVQDPFDDAVLNLERLLTASMIESIDISDNSLNNGGEIVINYRIDNNETDIKKKKIYLNTSKKSIIIETYKNNFKMGVNILMTDVLSFEIIKKSNIYYLKITNVNTDERIICI
ncbi:prepilin-type cleavage/methylation domain-containing protein [Clostridium sp. AL.422]|uniref:prepilin-type N-terminal cleavage/methylation domain-containing protein n=1 Tax=Clostridium TaxID=1485 RepID=UPI00293DD7DA|nr:MULTISPECIES: prepilin-type cleavage/methylation domain-containing protein [unclassified Clostridium]MDV4152544.1 prepilin-type cleavage/methylation domain-containing protein [Clostridium sp. AL.422]